MPKLIPLLAVLAAITVTTECTRAADPSDYLSPPNHHRVFGGDATPGLVGYGRRLGRGPVVGYFQPVAFHGPEGAQFAFSQAGSFLASESKLMVGLQVGLPYRFKITGIPENEGAELYPSIELIDRTYPPPGLTTSYPVQVVIDRDDLANALDGRLVTKVVYLEDPQTAPAIDEQPDSGRTVEITQSQNPLAVADRLGRPIAIVRIGSLAPPRNATLDPQFYFGDPSWAPIYQPEASSEFDPATAE